MIEAGLAGFFLGLSLIVAIGAQNAFVLRQGLKGQHVLAVVLACAVSDAVLISAGIAGFGALVTKFSWIEPLFLYAGVAFLAVYGLLRFRAAFGEAEHLDPAQSATTSLWPALLTCLAFTWLNPHVYLDTLVLMGSVSTGYAPHRFSFGVGAVLASFTFFFALGFGARLLRPLFAKPKAWRVLDFLVGVVMLALAIGLLLKG